MSILQSFVREGFGAILASAISETWWQIEGPVCGSLACEPWCADTGAIQPFSVTGASIQTADVGAGILVQFAMCSCRETDKKGVTHGAMEQSSTPVACESKVLE